MESMSFTFRAKKGSGNVDFPTSMELHGIVIHLEFSTLELMTVHQLTVVYGNVRLFRKLFLQLQYRIIT